MKKRQVELDLLRIIAMLAVVIVHTCGMETHNLEISNTNWQKLTFIAALMTWQVPIFVMISGRFFLDTERKIGVSKISQAIKRLVIAFLVWDIAYQVYYCLSDAYDGLNWKGIVSQSIRGPFHFWYIYMLIGIYSIIPFLRKFATDKKLMEYYVGFYLLYSTLAYYGPEMPFFGGTIDSVIKSADFHFVLGYPVYFILGWYLYKYPLDKRRELLLYLLGGVLLLSASYFTVKKSVSLQSHYDWYTRYIYPNIVISSSAIYVLFTKRVSKLKFNNVSTKCITKLSELSFGVFLCHGLILATVGAMGLSPILMNPYFMVPLLAIFVTIISFVVVMLIRSIPYIGDRIT